MPGEGVVSGQVGKRKNKDHSYHTISLKSCILGDISFFRFPKFPGKEIECEKSNLLVVIQL